MNNLIEFQKATREEVCLVDSKRGFLIQSDPYLHVLLSFTTFFYLNLGKKSMCSSQFRRPITIINPKMIV